MADFPMLPLWTDSLLGDTQHLSQAEFGAYMLMLIVAWRSPRCTLPNDEKYIAKITRSGSNWRHVRANVMAFWQVDEKTGELFQKRLRAESQTLQKRRAQQTDAGNLSALKRHKTRSTVVALPLQRDANPLHHHHHHIQKESPVPSPSLDLATTSATARADDDDDLNGERLASWASEFGQTIPAASFVAWRNAGATADLIQSTIRNVLAVKPPGWKPSSMSYFGTAILRAIVDQRTAAAAAPASSAADQRRSDAEKTERFNAELIAKGMQQPDVSLAQVRIMVRKGLLTAEQAWNAGYR